MTAPRRDDDSGTITLLTLGFLGVLIGVAVTVVDVSAVYLDRRDLAGECDSAALAAAQSVDPGTLYASGIGATLPVTKASGASAADTVARTVGAGTATTTTIDGDSVTIACSRVVHLPVGAIVGFGSVTVRAGSTATSPIR